MTAIRQGSAQNRIAWSERNTFWLSLLVHVLLFVVYLLSFMHRYPLVPPEKKPALYVPAYVYHEAATAMKPVTASVQKQRIEKPLASAQRIETNLDQFKGDFNLANYHKQIQQKANEQAAAASETPANFNPAEAYKRQQAPVYMIGDKLVDDPLKKLLGIAISKHLYYPQVAQELFIHGVVGVGFTLYPDGNVTNVKIVQSSRERMLDAAALSAINEMTPVANVDIYLKKPRFLVVKIIFN